MNKDQLRADYNSNVELLSKVIDEQRERIAVLDVLAANLANALADVLQYGHDPEVTGEYRAGEQALQAYREATNTKDNG